MEINVQFVKMPTSESLEAFAIKKLERLEKRYEWIIKAEVFYKLDNDPKKKGKICDIQLSLPGPRIFARSNEENFEVSTDETINDLEKQLKKRKKDMKPHL